VFNPIGTTEPFDGLFSGETTISECPNTGPGTRLAETSEK